MNLSASETADLASWLCLLETNVTKSDRSETGNNLEPEL